MNESSCLMFLMSFPPPPKHLPNARPTNTWGFSTKGPNNLAASCRFPLNTKHELAVRLENPAFISWQPLAPGHWRNASMKAKQRFRDTGAFRIADLRGGCWFWGLAYFCWGGPSKNLHVFKSGKHSSVFVWGIGPGRRNGATAVLWCLLKATQRGSLKTL